MNMNSTNQSEESENMWDHDERTAEDLKMQDIIEDVWLKCNEEQQDVLSDGEALGWMGLSGLMDYSESEGLMP